MKSLIVAVIIFFMGISFIQAQEELAIGELIINFENRPASWNITVKIEACGAVWNQYHELTTEFLGGEASYSQNSQRMFHASDLD
jgi:hypothetical protein